MKRIFKLLVILTVLALPLTAFAATLPVDYEKKGELDGQYACDKGKTTVKQYLHDEWAVLEVYAESGDVLLVLGSADGLTFFVKRASGAVDDMGILSEITQEEWNQALVKASPAIFNILYGTGPSDCEAASPPAPAPTN